MTEPAGAISVSNIHKRFGSLEVLTGVSLTAREGDVIAIKGRPMQSGRLKKFIATIN